GGIDTVGIHVWDSLVWIEAARFAVLVGHGIGLDHDLAGADRADPADAALAVANHLLLDDEALLAVFAFHYSRRPVAESRVDVILPEIVLFVLDRINGERVPEGLLPCGRR